MGKMTLVDDNPRMQKQYRWKARNVISAMGRRLGLIYGANE